MAGIGFELNKILSKKGYLAVFQAYAYAGVIGSGAWLIAVISLGFLGTVLATLDMMADRRVFFVSISVIYGFTLVLTGPIQLVLTRHVADQEYANKSNTIFPTYLACLGWVAFSFAILGAFFFVGFVPGPPLYQWSAALLSAIVASIWISSIFLSALKNYYALLLGFAAGCGVSFVASWQLAIHFGLGGAMLGFTLGHGLLLLILTGVIYRELGDTQAPAGDFFSCFRKYWDLALAGLLYNLGVWMDKFLYWWIDPQSEVVAGVLRASPVFDRVVYFSFLTILPGMAVFLLKLETEFATKNLLFSQHVLKKGTMRQIRQIKTEMIESLREGLLLLIKVQGFFTGFLILGADRVMNLLQLGAVQSGVLQVSLVGLFLLVIFLALQTILFYLDKRFDAMLCCLIFTVVNGGVTTLSISVGERMYGVGFLMAAATAVITAALMVNHHLKDLEYDTFAMQPLYGAPESALSQAAPPLQRKALGRNPP
ncbi:MAG: exopolysaccharide Pel transporter PelG [Verrucomicrobia bacterium]|nr:exopolysaccharide Pel transporter PelG [Verrucomicrobiota bacterium]